MLILTKLVLAITILGNLSLLFVINFFDSIKTKFRCILNFYLIGILGWTGAILLNLYLESLLVEKFIFAFPAIVMASHFALAEVFPRGTFFAKFRNYLLLIPPLVFFIASFWDNAYFTQINVTKEGYTILDQGFLSLPYTLFITLYMSFPIFILYKKYKAEKNFLVKSQLKYLLVGFVLFLFSAILSNLILPYFFNFYFLNGVGPILSLLMIAFIMFDVVYFHLFDIQFIIRLAAIYSFLFAIITFIYAFLVSHISSYVGGALQYLIPSAIVVFGFTPFKNFIEFSTDKIFFRRRYNFSDVVKKIEEGVHLAGLDLDKALESTNRIIKDSLKVERAVILILIPKDNFISRQTIDGDMAGLEIKRDNPIINYLKSRKGIILDKYLLMRKIDESDSATDIEREAARELEALGYCVAVPIELRDELIGVYLLGHKLSGALFSREDIRLLEHVTWEMGFAIDNARSYEELKKLNKLKSEFISTIF